MPNCAICQQDVNNCIRTIDHRVGGRTTNVVALWLELISTPERAKKLRPRLATLKSPPIDPEFGPEPAQCPTTILFGYNISKALYGTEYRVALDAWDQGMVTASDLHRWCLWIEQGKYSGPSYTV